MSKSNKLKIRSKSVAVLGVTGACLFLSEPTLIKADNLQSNITKVQENQVGDNLQDKSQDNSFKTDNLQTDNSQTNGVKSNNSQNPQDSNVKSENIQDRDVESNSQQNNSAKSFNIQSNEVKSEDGTKSSNSQPSTTNVQETQIIEFSQGNGIWSVPYGLQGANYIDSTNKHAGKEVQLIQKMVVNNATWYQFSIDGKTIGWLDSKVLSKLSNIQEINQDFIMGATFNNGIWSLPYGVKGANYVDNSDKYAYDNIKLIEKATFGDTTWYKFSVDGKVIGWVDAKALDKGEAKPANFSITIGTTNGNGIWSKPYGVMGAQYLGSTNNYAYQTVQVIKTVKKGVTNWYQVKNDKGVVGWIDGDKAVTDLENLPVENSSALIGGSAKPSDGIWSVPYGEYGAHWIASVSDYSFKQVKVIQKVKKNNIVWSKITLGDKVLGWIDSRTLSNLVINEENKTVLLGDTYGHDVWTLPYGEKNAKYVGSANNYVNKPIKVIGSLTTEQTVWYHFTVEGKEVGWIDSKAVSNASNIVEMNETYHVSNTQGHTVWSRPYGMQNAAYIGSASDFTNKNLNVKLSVNYNGVTWYGFKNSKGNLNWIDSRAVVQGSTYPHLDVPIISQRDPYIPSRNLVSGCEITSVTMMLQYAGANVDKVQLAYEMPYSSFDPNQGFVGNPFGRGWTIYPPALMDLVRKYTGSAINLTGLEIKSNLDAGKPVVVWMTMHGFTVHAITLVGYDENYFYYNDPWTGEKNASMYWSDFYNNWSTQNRRAISY
ncbi:GW domain-containing glycosaminoglycan-binding protein [Bacillus multifaciens]|uniref:GW domain-containing glycosaminoglycan-binding protein n=1 Tax=Bacillus multifaciens TaxID=3068506 RepID=UPI0027423C29|nr:GW domain-containing glycosaminoglycan-binding protein [Bacillus sp. WLY-B-L8]MDP7977849.1 GW domain-containing glycosaminoglycan-binding protein [Bacillus sp. WLY-B-L8]